MGRYKIIILSLIVLTSVITGIGFYYSDPVARGLCSNIYGDCFDNVVGISEPITFLSVAILIPLIVMAFLRREIFYIWLKFAIPALALGLAWIFATPTSFVGGGLGLGSSPVAEREGVTWIVSTLFLLISVVVIVLKLVKHRKRDEDNQ